MKPTVTTVLMPPVAVLRYGHANATAAPIAVFWIFGLLGVCYGMLGGIFAQDGISWIEIVLGLVLWAASSIAAKLVIQAVEHDMEHREDSTLDHTVEPSLEEPDPLEETRVR